MGGLVNFSVIYKPRLHLKDKVLRRSVEHTALSGHMSCWHIPTRYPQKIILLYTPDDLLHIQHPEPFRETSLVSLIDYCVIARLKMISCCFYFWMSVSVVP